MPSEDRELQQAMTRREPPRWPAEAGMPDESEQMRRFNATKIEDVKRDAGQTLQMLGVPLFGGVQESIDRPIPPAAQRAAAHAGGAARSVTAEMGKMESLPTSRRLGVQVGFGAQIGEPALTPETYRLAAERSRASHAHRWSKWSQLQGLIEREIGENLQKMDAKWLERYNRLRGIELGNRTTAALDKMRAFLNEQAAAKELAKRGMQTVKLINPVMAFASAVTGALTVPAIFFDEFAKSQEFEPQLRFLAQVGVRRPLRPEDIDPNVIPALRQNPETTQTLFNDGTLSQELMDRINSSQEY